ncbi:hypothetical protein PILCRDRAFT_819848, partial [Piloderma croceum F 1598]
MNEVRSHKQLVILQGTGPPAAMGPHPLNFNSAGIQLRAVEPKLAPSSPSLAKLIESTVSAFGRLEVVHHDINPGNLLISIKIVCSIM